MKKMILFACLISSQFGFSALLQRTFRAALRSPHARRAMTVVLPADQSDDSDSHSPLPASSDGIALNDRIGRVHPAKGEDFSSYVPDSIAPVTLHFHAKGEGLIFFDSARREVLIPRHPDGSLKPYWNESSKRLPLLFAALCSADPSEGSREDAVVLKSAFFTYALGVGTLASTHSFSMGFAVALATGILSPNIFRLISEVMWISSAEEACLCCTPQELVDYISACQVGSPYNFELYGAALKQLEE